MIPIKKMKINWALLMKKFELKESFDQSDDIRLSIYFKKIRLFENVKQTINSLLTF